MERRTARSGGRGPLISCPTLLAELADVLTRKKLASAVTASGLTADQLMQQYHRLSTVIHPGPISPTVLSDPNDDHVLACAFAAKAEFVISGDRDLLRLRQYQDIRIVNAAEALKLFR